MPCPSCRPTNSVKALKAPHLTVIILIIINVFVSVPSGRNFRGAGGRQCVTEKREERKPGRRGMSLA